METERRKEGLSARERLILSGIAEIEENGLQDFSIRRVAEACGVSCAAPYKHFKNRQEFVEAIIEYVYERWGEQRERLAAEAPEDKRRQLVKISVGFVRFLHENPSFRSIIMLRDSDAEGGSAPMLLRLTEGSREIVRQYCAEVGMAPEVRRRKVFVVRSLIYGAALMLDSGELPDDEAGFAMAEAMIEREFDLE
ncbi:MAG: TetR/AcrR family transcriptional regulator [Oscillospiraceae bacterium]|nr:TetR/AcrR family transcriptional regulator [Oscillospiraceae bacterium]